MKRILKKICKAIVVTFIVATPIVHILYAFTLGKTVQYLEVPYKSAKVSSEINGYRIGFLSDVHSSEQVQEVADMLNEQKLDLLLLGGDFSNNSTEMEESIQMLSKIATKNGIFGVEGNHDNYKNLFAKMQESGITALDNCGFSLNNGIYVAGVHDYWNRTPDVKKAVENADKDDFVLLVSHNPDIAMAQDISNVDIMLSGHTHGGEITFYGIWAPALTLTKHNTKHGQMFASGWSGEPFNRKVFVSTGLGNQSGYRIFTRPQVVIITLQSE